MDDIPDNFFAESGRILAIPIVDGEEVALSWTSLDTLPDTSILVIPRKSSVALIALIVK